MALKSESADFTTSERIGALTRKNTRLASALKAAQQELAALHEQIEGLNQPPLSAGLVLCTEARKKRADIWLGGRKIVAEIAQSLSASQLYPGQEVLLNEHLVIVEVRPQAAGGEVVLCRQTLSKGRILALVRPDEEQVFQLAGELVGKVKAGDLLCVDLRAKIALSIIPHTEVSELILAEPPETSYTDIGGLEEQLQVIHESIEMPLLYPDLYRKFSLQPPRGVLLYGPPGCGKTMIAKAVANSIGKQLTASSPTNGAASSSVHREAYFLNIKGPQLLNKYVGESERQIRLIFERARELAKAGSVVVIFFDEMESLFRIRGAGRSSDVETTIVPQLLSEIDGVEALDNVVIIGASNREDMLDPAILRPGRLDLKLYVGRPNAGGIRQILKLNLHSDTPFSSSLYADTDMDTDTIIENLVTSCAAQLEQKNESTALAKMTLTNGETKILYFADVLSGAVVANIVKRAKQLAIRDIIRKTDDGLRAEHLAIATRQQWQEILGLIKTDSPQEWAKVTGINTGEITAIERLYHT